MSRALSISLLATAAALGAAPPEPEVEIAGRFDDKIVYGVASEGVDVERLKQDCRERGGRFDECGSACAPGAICASVCAFTCELGEGAGDESSPVEEMWVRYTSSEAGFEIEHPTSVDVRRLGEERASVRFVEDGGAGPVEGDEPWAGIVLTVERRELAPGESLREVANELPSPPGPVELLTLGALEGFASTSEKANDAVWLLGEPGSRVYWILRHGYRDPEGRGYREILDRMLRSFVARPAGDAAG